MDPSEVRGLAEHLVSRAEGACGIMHSVLELLTRLGFRAECLERPEGVEARIVDEEGDAVSTGRDVTWAPAILDALLELGAAPWEEELRRILTPDRDAKALARVFGWGRILTVDRAAARLVLREGGEIRVRREGLGSEVVIRCGDRESRYVSYCPACALALAAVRHPELKRALREELKDAPNTGREKAEDGVVNVVRVRRGVTLSELRFEDREPVRNRGCCAAYALVRAELKAGYGSESSRRLFKAYCDACPLKHCWVGRPVSSLGNAVLQRLTEEEGDVKFIVRRYPEVETPVGRGRGTLCALSACANAVLRLDASRLLRPDPSDPKAWGEG